MLLSIENKRSKSSYYSYVRFTDGKTVIHKLKMMESIEK